MDPEHIRAALDNISSDKAKWDSFMKIRYFGKLYPERFVFQTMSTEPLKLKGSIKGNEDGSVVRFEILHPSKVNMRIALLNGLLVPIILGFGIWRLIAAPTSLSTYLFLGISVFVYFGLRGWYRMMDSKPDVDAEARYLEKLFQGKLEILEQPRSPKRKELTAPVAKS